MGDKRLHSHMTYLVRNLDYGYESGRKVVLEVMARIVSKLPLALLVQYLELFFLPLVTRLVNDDSTTCRTMVGVLLKELMARAPRKQLDTLVDLILEWAGGSELLLRRAAAQVLGLLVEQQGSGAERYMGRVLSALTHSVNVSLSATETGGEWESIYHLLTAAEKLHAALTQLPHTPDYLSDIALLLCSRVLHHRHTWVQLAAARVLGRALGAIDPKAQGGVGLRKLLTACGGAFALVRGMCAQVASDSFDERLSEQVLRNLIHLCTALHHDRKLVKDSEVDAAHPEDGEDDDDDEDEEGGARGVHGVSLEDAAGISHRRQEDEGEEGEGGGGGRNNTGKTQLKKGVELEKKEEEGGGEGEGGEVEVVAVEPVRAVKWLFQRLSHIARRHNGQRRTCVFQFFAAMGVRMGAGALLPLLAQVTAPLYRAIETDTESSRDVRGKDLAQEVVEVLQGVTGHDLFYAAYNACRTRQKLKKEQRRSEKSLKKLLDPQGAAAARIGKNQRKVKSKKRKIENHKDARGAKRLHHEEDPERA